MFLLHLYYNRPSSFPLSLLIVATIYCYCWGQISSREVRILHCDAFSRVTIQKLHSAGWRRPIECLKLQVIFRRRATDYEALLRKMTYKDKVSHDWSLWFEMGMCVHTWHGAKPGREVTGQLPLEVSCHHLSVARHREVACRALFCFHTHTQQTSDTHAQTRLNVCTGRRVVDRYQWGKM